MDPDPEIREGASHPHPEIRGGPVYKRNLTALRVSIWLKIRGGGEGAGSLGPSPGPAADDIEHQIFIHIDFVSMTRCFPTQPRPQGLFVFQYVGEKRED